MVWHRWKYGGVVTIQSAKSSLFFLLTFFFDFFLTWLDFRLTLWPMDFLCQHNSQETFSSFMIILSDSANHLTSNLHRTITTYVIIASGSIRILQKSILPSPVITFLALSLFWSPMSHGSIWPPIKTSSGLNLLLRPRGHRGWLYQSLLRSSAVQFQSRSQTVFVSWQNFHISQILTLTEV